MMIRFARSTFASLFCLGMISLFGSIASAAPIVIYGTGETSTGTSAAVGSTDLHYTLVSAPTGVSTPFISNDHPAPWVPNTPTGQWIGVQTNAGVGNPAGTYDYRTTFSLAGLDSTTASLQGLVAADNTVTILLNGQATAYTNFGAYNTLSSFTLTSGFLGAVNTLDFIVTNFDNGSNPTGLLVNVAGTAVPEPASIVMLGLGAIGLVGFGLRRRAIV